MYERGIFNGLWLYGFRDEEERLPMKENSIFHLASITKQFTASAIILLKRQGLLCLEDRLTEYFRNSLRIKTRRSGIFWLIRAACLMMKISNGLLNYGESSGYFLKMI